MIDKQFDKETFKKSVKDNVKFLYRRKLEEATQEQLFQAVSYTVKDVIIDNWLAVDSFRETYTPKSMNPTSTKLPALVNRSPFLSSQNSS